MAKPVLQVIIGSTRPGRVGSAVADWIIDRARARGDFEVEVTDTGGAGRGDLTAADGITAAAEPGGSQRLEHGLGLAVIAGLADDVQISESPGGVSIRMSWPAVGLGR